MTVPVTVLLLSDHDHVRTSVRALLEALPDLVVVSAPASESEYLGQAAARRPDAAIIDGGIAGLGAERLVAAIHDLNPHAAIIVLALETAPSDVTAMLQAGARGYLLKETAARELEPALRAVVAGGTYLGARVTL